MGAELGWGRGLLVFEQLAAGDEGLPLVEKEEIRKCGIFADRVCVVLVHGVTGEPLLLIIETRGNDGGGGQHFIIHCCWCCINK